MSQLIKLKRGTRSQIIAGSLSLGEPAFSTDTKEVYVGDGVSANLIGKPLADVASAKPPAGFAGRLFYATDENYLYVDDGSNWNLFDPVGIQQYDYVTSTTFDTGNKRLIIADASSNDITINLSSSQQINGRTYYISRIDTSTSNTVFVEGSGVNFLIGDPSVAVGGGYDIGGMDLNDQRFLEIMWDGSLWRKLNEVTRVDGGFF